MRVEITTHTDDYDCETCGATYAEGGSVKVDGEEVLNAPALAHCYGGSSYSESDLLVITLYKLGIEVFVDGQRYNVSYYHEDYDGELQ